MQVDEWTERELLATRPALGLSPADPEPQTVYDRLTKDGQRLRAIIFGSGSEGDPYILRLECRKMDAGDLEVGVQEPGPARWPTLPEIADAASLVRDGATFRMPFVVSGALYGQPEDFTRVDLLQIGYAKGPGIDPGPRIHRPEGLGGEGDGPPVRH